jgi:hypothetical protein
VTAQTLSLADLYDGKLCAALDRQHPRDVFGVKLLLDNEGLASGLASGFNLLILLEVRSLGF